MTKAELKESVQSSIVKVKTKEALQQIKAFIKNSNHDYSQLDNAILMQMASLSKANQDKLNGVVTDDDFSRSLAKVNYATLEIADQIEEDDVAVTSNIENTSNPPAKGSSRGAMHNEAVNKIKVLFLTANPKASSRLKLDREIRFVKNGFQSSTKRDRFEFISEPAVTMADITMAITSQKPQIIHFSGHGLGKDGLVIEGSDGKIEHFTTEALGRLFRLFKDKVECVVLNACYSKEQAVAIGEEGIGSKNAQKGIYTVGTNNAIGDLAAIDFSRGFYQAIGEGHDYEFAFQMGLVHVNDSEAAKKSQIWFNGKKISDQ